MSLTRDLMAGLRSPLRAGRTALRPPPAAPIHAPPARVFPTPTTRTAFAAEASAHTTALVGIGHVGTRYATDVVLQFQAEMAVAHEAVAAELPVAWAAEQRPDAV